MHTGKDAGSVRLDRYRKLIFRLIAFRKVEAPVIDEHGARPVLVVDEHELVSDVLVQAGRTGGYANLFVVMDDDSFVGSSTLPKSSALSADAAETLEDAVHRDVEIGMLLEAARTAPNGLNFTVRLPRQGGELRDAKALPIRA